MPPGAGVGHDTAGDGVGGGGSWLTPFLVGVCLHIPFTFALVYFVPFGGIAPQERKELWTCGSDLEPGRCAVLYRLAIEHGRGTLRFIDVLF